MQPNHTTIGDELDRLDVKAGKIGMNSRDQAYGLLTGLDDVYRRMQEITNEQSRKVVETQFLTIVTRMKKESSLMLRDLGGTAALAKARESIQPPKEHIWWYLDEYLTGTRQNALRRGLFTGGIILAALVVLIVLYQAFLAPDPQVTARYSLEQSARDSLMAGELESALEKVEEGLAIAPTDPALTILKGVIQELMGHEAQAQANYAAAFDLFEQPAAFYVTRGQAFATANQPEQALTDAKEAIRLNPALPEAYLLSGQANEMLGQYGVALNDYEQAYSAAEAADQVQLSALARMRTAMLMQLIGSPALDGGPGVTETP